jgi:hypothetical protein
MPRLPGVGQLLGLYDGGEMGGGGGACEFGIGNTTKAKEGGGGGGLYKMVRCEVYSLVFP